MDPFIPIPPDNYGGIERVIYDIADQYVKRGHSVTLVAGPNSKSPGRLITYGENGQGNIRINLDVLRQVSGILKSEIPQHDVIHNFGRLAFLFPIAWTNIRKVQTYMRIVSSGNIKWLNRIGCRNISYTGVSDAICKTGIPGGGDWHTVYNCAPIEQFDFKEYTDPGSYLVFLGRIERCKGLHNAIEVAKKAQRPLIIAGNISTIAYELEYYENEIKPLIDGDQIKYIGQVNNTQKNELLGNASALLSPVEWFEPFPIIIPEAYACGTPVLGFNMGGIPEGIEHGVTGFISETTDEMAGHVNQIHQLKRRDCRQAAERNYSDFVIASGYLEIYQN